MGYGGKAGSGSTYGKENRDITTVKQKKLDPEAINKLIYDALSADKGIAQLISGENIAGGSNSSTATLMAQDFMTKLIGELATVTAADVTEEDGTIRKRGERADAEVSAGGDSVICTELVRQGKLDAEMHRAAYSHWLTIHILTKRGYWLWGTRFVPYMKKSTRLSDFFAVIASARYKMITTQKWNLLGALTIYVGHPFCFCLGALTSLGDIRVRIEVQSS